MTRCGKKEFNLKSSAYNQTGESLFEQLSAYNSMSSHIRRVLLATSVVDSKNESYMRKRKHMCKAANTKLRIFKGELTNELIDRLAYDTMHHPADILRMNCDPNCSYQQEDQKHLNNYYGDDYHACNTGSGMHNQTFYDECNRLCCRNQQMSGINKPAPLKSCNRQIKPRIIFEKNNTSRGRKNESVEAGTNLIINDHYQEQGYDDDSFESSSDYPSLIRETNHLSLLSSPSQIYMGCESGQKYDKATSDQEINQENNDNKYTDFVYEITQEIMNNRLYTDEEFQEVFKKHIEKNKGILSMNKMLCEIHRLKMALNVMDDSDNSFEEIQTQKLLRSEIPAPKPRKIVNNNKVIEKLIPNQTKYIKDKDIKSVRLIDENRQLLVTERDVLTSLVEADIEFEQAQQICKRLFYKNKATNFTNMTKEELNSEDFNSSCGGSSRDKSCLTNDLVPKADKNV